MLNLTLDCYRFAPDGALDTLLHEVGLPLLPFEHIVLLGKRAVAVYDLHDKACIISVAELLEYILAFIATAFGAALLKSLQ